MNPKRLCEILRSNEKMCVPTFGKKYPFYAYNSDQKAIALYNTIKYIYVHQNRPKIGQEMSANCFALCVIIILCPRSFILETLMSPGWVVKTISKLLLLPAGTKQLFSLYSALTEIIKWTINKNLFIFILVYPFIPLSLSITTRLMY